LSCCAFAALSLPPQSAQAQIALEDSCVVAAIASTSGCEVDTAIGNAIIGCALWTSATITLDELVIPSESSGTLATSRGPSAPDDTRSRCGYLAAVTTGGAKTVSFEMSASVAGSGAGFVVVLSGHDAADFLEAENYAASSGANGSTSVSCGNAGCAIVSIHNNNAGDASAGSGYTQVTIPDVHWYIQGEYIVDAGGAGAKTVDYSHSSGDYTVNAIAVNAAGGGSGGCPVCVIIQHMTAQKRR
jgi:hypothetical protein